MESGPLRVYLTGKVAVEIGGRTIGERQFPARQGRIAFAYLVCSRGRPVPRDELAEAVWGEAPPLAWETALSALVSKLRRLLSSTGLPPDSAAISGDTGRYQIRLPVDAWWM